MTKDTLIEIFSDTEKLYGTDETLKAAVKIQSPVQNFLTPKIIPPFLQKNLTPQKFLLPNNALSRRRSNCAKLIPMQESPYIISPLQQIPAAESNTAAALKKKPFAAVPRFTPR